MTIWNFGSVNIDHVLRVPHLPQAGETLAASDSSTGLGGKGANQSVAAARSGATVRHIGAVGRDGEEVRAVLEAAGVDLSWLDIVEGPTGRAQILVDDAGENCIVLLAGANAQLPARQLERALADAAPGDTLMLQNETPHQAKAAAIAREAGLRVVYSAAPFEAQAVRAVLDHVSLLLVNEIEAAQLSDALGVALTDLPVPAIAITRGAAGAVYHDLAGGEVMERPSPKVEAIDTTGAGDCFAGYLVGGLDMGRSPGAALDRALAAAALAVTRAGATQAIPTAEQVDAFLSR